MNRQEMDWHEVMRLTTDAEVVGEVTALVTAVRAAADDEHIGFIEGVTAMVDSPERSAAAMFILTALMVPLLDIVDGAGVDSQRFLQRVALRYQ